MNKLLKFGLVSFLAVFFLACLVAHAADMKSVKVQKTIENLSERPAKAFVDFSHKELQDKTVYENKLKLFLDQILK